MKKAIFLFITVALAALSVPCAAETNWHLAVEPLFGMKWGQVDEYVYERATDGDYEKLSELNWEIKNACFYGVNVSGGYKRLYGDLHCSSVLRGDSGIMADSDWMDLNGIKTTYSESENSITQAFTFAIDVEYHFTPTRTLMLAPTAAFEYKTISFEARNGKGWYGHLASPHVAWNDASAVYYPEGSLCGIDYKRDVYQCLFGVAVAYKPVERLRLTGTITVVPYAYTLSYDTHYSNTAATEGTDYADEVTFIFRRFKATTGCFFLLNKRWEFGLTISGFYARESDGDNYQKKHNESLYTNITAQNDTEKGGAGAWELSAALSCRFNIF